MQKGFNFRRPRIRRGLKYVSPNNRSSPMIDNEGEAPAQGLLGNLSGMLSNTSVSNQIGISQNSPVLISNPLRPTAQQSNTFPNPPPSEVKLFVPSNQPGFSPSPPLGHTDFFGNIPPSQPGLFGNPPNQPGLFGNPSNQPGLFINQSPNQPPTQPELFGNPPLDQPISTHHIIPNYDSSIPEKDAVHGSSSDNYFNTSTLVGRSLFQSQDSSTNALAQLNPPINQQNIYNHYLPMSNTQSILLIKI